MLSRAHALLKQDGHLFLVLPLACVDNSRYFTEERLLDIVGHIGFEYVKSQRTAKLAMYMLKRGEGEEGGEGGGEGNAELGEVGESERGGGEKRGTSGKGVASAGKRKAADAVASAQTKKRRKGNAPTTASGGNTDSDCEGEGEESSGGGGVDGRRIVFGKELLRSGKDRNNFAIVLRE